MEEAEIMNIQKLRLITLSPLNYYYTEAGSGMLPSNFIGDIALKYALLHQLGLDNFFQPGKRNPTYQEDLVPYKFWFTVAMPPFFSIGKGESTPELTKPIKRNTMQGIDYNGTNVHPLVRTGSIMYKNFYFQQFIKPGNIFYSILISKEHLELPQVLRLGTGKTGMVKIEIVENIDIKPYINLYTIKNILKKDEIYKRLSKREFTYFEHFLLQYFVVGPVSMKDIEESYGGYV